MGTNCAPLLSDIFLYSYEAEFIQSLLSTKRKQLAPRFNFTYRYIDNVLSIKTQSLRITCVRCISLNLRLKTRQRARRRLPTLINSLGRNGQFHTSIYYKHSACNFHFTNFPFLSSNMRRVIISQLIRYARVCSSYGSFFSEGQATFKKASETWLHQGAIVIEEVLWSMRGSYQTI